MTVLSSFSSGGGTALPGIEKNVPFPANVRGCAGSGMKERRAALIRTMEVGDSIFVTEAVSSWQNSFTAVSKETGWKFIGKMDGKKKKRFWRSA